MFKKMLEQRRLKRLLAREPATLDSDERDELRFLQDKYGEAGASDARAASLAGYGDTKSADE
jgi:hypothetical protein